MSYQTSWSRVDLTTKKLAWNVKNSPIVKLPCLWTGKEFVETYFEYQCQFYYLLHLFSGRNGGRRGGAGSGVSGGHDHDALSDTMSHHSVQVSALLIFFFSSVAPDIWIHYSICRVWEFSVQYNVCCKARGVFATLHFHLIYKQVQ
jgi:hypothetical protein